ncbi:37S ribosomal protein S22 [Mitosporidium daphniae]
MRFPHTNALFYTSSSRLKILDSISVEKFFSIPHQNNLSENENKNKNDEDEDEDENETPDSYLGFDRSPEAKYGHLKIGMVIFPEFIREQLRLAHKNNPYKYLFNKDVARINAIAQAANQILPPSPDFRDNRILSPCSKRLADVDFSHLSREYNERDALAYATVQSPLTYAPIFRVFSELTRRFPDWAPSSVLDFGCGPGTALWAAKAIWGNRLGTCTGVDLSEAMIDFADKITSKLGGEHAIEAIYRRYLHFHNEKGQFYEMVIASFVLNELDSVPTKEGDRPVLELTLNNLWKSTNSFLVLVERGSPLGSKLIIQARDHILAKGNAQVVAPCPHSGTCPMLVLQKKSKDGPPLQESRPQNWPRIIVGPNKLKKRVVLDLCTPEGTLQRHQIPKSCGREQYYDARKSQLGDLWPYHPPTLKPHIHYDFGRAGRVRTDQNRHFSLNDQNATNQNINNNFAGPPADKKGIDGYQEHVSVRFQNEERGPDLDFDGNSV